MKRLVDSYFRLLKILLTGMIIVLTVPVFLQVLSRFIGFIPRYIWTEEIARFAFIWVIMLGATIAVRDKTHFAIDMLPKFSPKVERSMHLLLMVSMLLFAIVFIVGGIQFARFGATQQSEISELPMLAIYIAWPIAGLSWVLFLLEQIYDHFEGNAPKGSKS